jgi:hypothetical protein
MISAALLQANGNENCEPETKSLAAGLKQRGIPRDLFLEIQLARRQLALKRCTLSGLAPAGYGIDFGILSTGETALVEVNDFYSLGC